ncbi:MAG: carboxymuconolactone decarboxylase family protein [Nitrospirae bacterium]|nr:carboxymuconolactone decarboxylase family protein [Nitrospirota bacterium]
MKLDIRIKELIAVGASVTANCQPCLQYHVGKAKESGADEQEIAEAVKVGTAVRKGAASGIDKLALGLAKGDNAAPVSSGGGCGCS